MSSSWIVARLLLVTSRCLLLLVCQQKHVEVLEDHGGVKSSIAMGHRFLFGQRQKFHILC